MINIDYVTSGAQFTASSMKDTADEKKEKPSKHVRLESFYQKGLKKMSNKDGNTLEIK